MLQAGFICIPNSTLTANVPFWKLFHLKNNIFHLPASHCWGLGARLSWLRHGAGGERSLWSSPSCRGSRRGSHCSWRIELQCCANHSATLGRTGSHGQFMGWVWSFQLQPLPVQMTVLAACTGICWHPGSLVAIAVWGSHRVPGLVGTPGLQSPFPALLSPAVLS